MNRAYLKPFLIGTILALSITSSHSEMIPTGSRPWKMQPISPEETAERLVNLLGETDYFSIYDYVSRDVVNHYKEAMIQFKPEQIGFNLDLMGIGLSDVGNRYGFVAYFDQGLASISESAEGWGNRFIEEEFKITSSSVNGKTALIQFRSNKNSYAAFFLKKEKDIWRLSQIKLDDFIWPIGLERESQPDDTDNPCNPPENPKNQLNG